MTTSACDTFFSLPELIALVAPYLTQKDLTSLISTNRHLRDICTPLFWHSLDLIYWEFHFGEEDTAQARLIASPESLQALFRNIDAVRAVYWRPDFSWYFFNAMLTYLHGTRSRSSSAAAAGQDTLEDRAQEETMISIKELTAANWGGMEIPSPFPVVPLPPLLHLTHYKGMVGMDVYGLTADLPPGYQHIPHHHQTFWLLRLNSSTLVYLELLTLDLDSSPVVRDLCRTLSGLPHLKFLMLNSLRQCELSSRELEALFFSCPTSLTELYIVPTVEDWHRVRNVQLEPQEGDWDYGQGPLVLRREFFVHLKTFEIPPSYSGYSESPLCDILEHCPALESLLIPSLKSTT
ncbi:hypothetical protein BGW39_001995, partial [Mortierella sp. 14UC]